MIIQILLRLLSTPKPTMNAQLFPGDRLDKMRFWYKILRPDCCRRLILNHKSHYNILLRIQIDIRNAAEAVLMQKQREEAQGVSVKVWALGGMSGWHPVLPPALQLTTLSHPQRCDCCWADVQRRDIIQIISHFLTPRDLSVRNESFNFHVPIHHNSKFCLWTSSQDDSLEGRLVGICRPWLMMVTPGPGCRHLLSQSESRAGVRLTNERPASACSGPSSQGEETAVSSVVVQCFSG